MRKLYWSFIAATAVGIALAGAPASAQPQTTICTGASLPAGTYINVLVPSSNPSCSLGAGVTVTGNVTDQGFLNLNTGAVVQGNVLVTAGATLRILGGTVNGSVSSNNALHVEIQGNGSICTSSLKAACTALDDGLEGTVGTNVMLVGTINGILITNANIIGSLTISGTQSGPIEVVVNIVGSNVLLSGNTTTGGAPNDVVAENLIGGNLTCVANTPAPDDFGVPNTVTGHKSGQCKGL